jgi:membrane protein implicated in regulation of membrane protease activity
VWLFIAVAFALLEVTLLGGSFVLAPFAVSAFAASLLGFYDVAIEVQWAVFVLGGSAMWVGFYRWAKTFLRDNVLPPGVGANRLVGMVGIITVPVDPTDTSRPGRMKVAGEIWSVTASDDGPLSAGTKVRITSVQGTRAVVEPVRADDPT